MPDLRSLEAKLHHRVLAARRISRQSIDRCFPCLPLYTSHALAGRLSATAYASAGITGFLQINLIGRGHDLHPGIVLRLRFLTGTVHHTWFLLILRQNRRRQKDEQHSQEQNRQYRAINPHISIITHPLKHKGPVCTLHTGLSNSREDLPRPHEFQHQPQRGRLNEVPAGLLTV